jgi:hypothetical protein
MEYFVNFFTKVLAKYSLNEDVDVCESALPHDAIKNAFYYHGTTTERKAQKIWKHGIKPNMSRTKGFSRAVDDRVYISKNVGYALHYALGAAVAGTNSEYIYDLIKKRGRYGFMFVISGKELQNIHPDEDQIGEAARDAFDKKKRKWLRDLAEDYLEVEPVEEYNATLLEEVIQGCYDAWIKAGKILLPLLSDKQKLELIDEYGNIAHEGILMPSQMWRIDRSKIPLLKKDGSNFFEIAEKIGSR